ncbi:iron-siderophore ABC transporter substrate-binding protein [Luteimicrobium subarcticum]|uniref:Iron complex transport system substrate-binding protein n=1 Tax=Luteimicrobium subarcticum TaxID=620910 RepID=A0A2M8W3K5_9MICO|nr:iron-siderophore ABC transporter substrate-binding protein [Luteimicrobium subarcticum]PJI85522.1 iron complex transport system substrate-binding protein [Luteimicrobium subarcticum]
MRSRLLALGATLTAAASAFALAGCGTTEDPADAQTAAASSGPVSITDERGTVQLDHPATKIVSLEWGLTENLVALGVKPVGEADVKGYNTWDTVAPIDASTPDVGQRGEPSLDAIVALDPDLVVTTTDLPENVLKQIAKKVPVLALRGSDASDPIGYMRKTVDTLAEATGTQAKAKEVLATYDAKIADAKARLAAAGKDGAPFTMSDGWVENGTVSVRMYTPGSFFGGVAADLGLQNQWTEGGDKDYGLAQTDVEGLTTITDADSTFVYAASDDDGGDPFVDPVKDNKVWQGLPFVKAGNVKRIPDGIWMFGGPLAAEAYADALVSALTD